MKKTVFFVFAALIAIILPSCSDDDTPTYVPDNIFVDIVTYQGITDNVATFTFQQKEDSPEITLKARNFSETNWEKGYRVMISYLPDNGVRYVSDYVSLYSYSFIFNGKVSVDDMSKYPNWDFAPIYVYDLWRTGTYLNLYSLMTYSYNPQFKVIVDEQTLNNDYPDLYLTYELGADAESRENAFNASIDISSVWDLPTCYGVNIHMNNSNGEKTIKLEKIQTIKPVE